MHEVRIQRVTNGVIVTIGCHTFVHNNIVEAMKWIEQYLQSPAVTMKKWKTVLQNWYNIQEELGQEEPIDRPEFRGDEVCEQARPRPDRIRRGESAAGRGVMEGGGLASPSGANRISTERLRR
jgi:hypothetical protein